MKTMQEGTLNRAMVTALHAMGLERLDKNRNSYVTHLIQTCASVREGLVEAGFNPNDEEVLAAAVLHDTVEDTDVTLDSLRTSGFTERTVALVDALTKRKGECYGEYLLRVKAGGPMAMLIKVSDATDNADLSRGRGTPQISDFDRTLRYALALEVLTADDPMTELAALCALGYEMDGRRVYADSPFAAFMERILNERCGTGPGAAMHLNMCQIEAHAVRERGIKYVGAVKDERLMVRRHE